MLLQVDRDMEIAVGKLGLVKFNKGVYAYVGSALGGLEHRVTRHLQRKKHQFWHIDYLTSSQQVKVSKVLFIDSEEKKECFLSMMIDTSLGVIVVKKGFGSSDCKCESHLYHLPKYSIPLVAEELRVKLDAYGLRLNTLPIRTKPSGVS